MNYAMWLQFVTNLAGAVATANGNAPRELKYLSLATNVATLVAMTDQDLLSLTGKYEAEVASGITTTPEELEEIAARIQARGERIQGS